MFVGESVRERLDIVLRWLSDRSIDITVIEFQLLEDGDRLYLDAEQTIPTPEHAISDVSPDTSEEPWKEDGRSWHLNERSNDQTADLLERVTAALEELDFLDGPGWGQKHYVSFVQGRKRRIAIRTKRSLFHIDVYDIDPTSVDVDELSEQLGIPEDAISIEDDLRNSGRTGVRITCKPEFDANLDEFERIFRNLFEKK